MIVLAAVVGFLALGSVADGYVPAPTVLTDRLAVGGLLKLATYKAFHPSGCDLSKASVRHEWATLDKPTQKDYIRSVLCLMQQPSQIDPNFAPGARTRYDDFVAVHANQTPIAHGNANFLFWHRWYLHAYEKALQEECGYKGVLPYWNWGKSAFDPINSPYFDGSDTSIGSNGVYEFHNATQAIPTNLNPIPPGVGGGCIHSSPFKNMTVNLGPLVPTLAVEGNVPQKGNGLAYNPRCLKRDISSFPSSRWTKDSDIARLITQYKDIGSFQDNMQGGNFSTGDYNLHAAGHYTYQGDPAGDFFFSPGDPMFFLHHAAIDWTWWIWQNQDLPKRYNEVAGTITFNNVPPSRNGTLQDSVSFDVLGVRTITLDELKSTTGGPFCYIYA